MKVLITGGAGFIGSWTAEKLLEHGYDLRVVDSLESQVHPSGKAEWLDDRTEILTGDISRKDVWERALDGVDAVIHLAGLTGIGQSMYQPLRYLNVNSIGTAVLYQLLLERQDLRSQIKKIVVASSKVIYGEGAYLCRNDGVFFPDLRPLEQLKSGVWEPACGKCGEAGTPVPIPESKPPQTLSIYALSKYDTERLALMYGNSLGISTVALRFFSVFGPRQTLSNPYTGVCSIFLTRLKNGNQPVIYEDGKQLRDFVYVEDAATANLAALESAAEGPINIGTGVGTGIENVASIVGEMVNSKVVPKITGEFRYGDTRSDIADVTRAKSELKWAPRWSFRKGLEKLVEWSESQEAKDGFESAERERKIILGR